MTPKQIERPSMLFLWKKSGVLFKNTSGARMYVYYPHFCDVWILINFPWVMITALGPIKGLLDYNCMRADMSSMIY